MLLKITDFMRRLTKEDRGLTLIELMIVLAILGVIALIAVPQITGYLETAERQTAEANANAIESAIHAKILERGDPIRDYDIDDDAFGDGYYDDLNSVTGEDFDLSGHLSEDVLDVGDFYYKISINESIDVEVKDGS